MNQRYFWSIEEIRKKTVDATECVSFVILGCVKDTIDAFVVSSVATKPRQHKTKKNTRHKQQQQCVSKWIQKMLFI